MVVYTSTLFLVFGFSYLADCSRSRSRKLNTEGEKKAYLGFACLVIAVLSLVSGLRWQVGTDYINYAILYEDIRTGGYAAVADQGIEIGFVAVCSFFSLFTQSPYAMFLFFAFVINILIVLALRDNSSLFWFAVVLYLLKYTYYSTFNILRQSCAMAIVFYGTKYITKGEFKKYLICVLLASTFHVSALIMLPVYFFVRLKAWSKGVLAVSLVLSLFYVFYDRLMPVIYSIIGNTAYGKYEAVIAAEDRGSSILRVVVAGAPVVLAVIFRKRLAQRIGHSNIAVNMCLIALFMALLSQKELYFGRLGAYFNIYKLLLLPYFVQIFEDRRMRFCVLLLFIVCYTGYCYVLMPTEGGVLPYQTIFDAPKGWNVMDYIFIRWE